MVRRHSSASISQGTDGPQDAGVVDQQVDRSQLAAQMGEGCGQAVGVGDIGGRCFGYAAGVANRGQSAIQVAPGACDEAHRGAGVGQSPGQVSPDPTSGAGHQGDRSAQVSGS
jgi:hypothetical protein